MDWERYRWGKAIECTFTPRPTWRGNGLKRGAAELQGKRMLLTVAWHMDEADNYPGEYALEAADDDTRGMLRGLNATWVASSDVTPNASLTVPAAGRVRTEKTRFNRSG